MFQPRQYCARAVSYGDLGKLGPFALVEMIVFLVILFIGLVLMGNAAEPADADGPPTVADRQVRREWGRIVRGERTFDARVWRWVSAVLWAQRFEVSFD